MTIYFTSSESLVMLQSEAAGISMMGVRIDHIFLCIKDAGDLQPYLLALFVLIHGQWIIECTSMELYMYIYLAMQLIKSYLTVAI